MKMCRYCEKEKECWRVFRCRVKLEEPARRDQMKQVLLWKLRSAMRRESQPLERDRPTPGHVGRAVTSRQRPPPHR
jgi:hypothetical protein